MNKLVNQAFSASKASHKNNKMNYDKIKKQFWQLVVRIRKEQVVLTPMDEEKLRFHMKKME